MNAKEFIQKFNEANILQTDWFEYMELPVEFDDALSEDNLVDSEVNVDKRRHYELSTNVYSFDGEFVGIEVISEIYNEMNDFEGIFHHLKAFEMFEVKAVTYIRKNE